MNFYVFQGKDLVKQSSQAMEADKKAGHEIGVVTLGNENLFFRKGLKTYCIPFTEIRGAFRRVQLIPATMCCGKGDLQIENLVVVSDSGEIAQVQLPGTKAAEALISEMKEKLPDIDYKARKQETAEGKE